MKKKKIIPIEGEEVQGQLQINKPEESVEIRILKIKVLRKLEDLKVSIE